jgi:repressor LexA
MTTSTRPTKKQKILLEFIESFIAQHGYSPSYREIMNGVGYNSVATVAVHINNLIARGHLVKRENSARSLEPVTNVSTSKGSDVQATEAAWLFIQIESRLKQLERTIDHDTMNEAYVLVGAVKVLGFTDQAVAYITRIRAIEKATK